MAKVGVQFSITDVPLQVVTKTTAARRRKNPIITTPGNLFNHYQRSHQMQYSAVLPIISLSSLFDLNEKSTRMTENNKSQKQTTTISSPPPIEFRLKIPSSDMSQTKSRITSSNRPVVTNIPKSSLGYPTIPTRPTTSYRSNQYHYHQQQQQQSPHYLYVVNQPVISRRIVSARIPNNNNNNNNNTNNLNPLPLHQQPHLLTSPLLPRPHPQYGHFLAYLRRQSLARIRRKQQEQQEGNTDNVETTITFNSTKPPTQVFQSSSNVSIGAVTPETSSMPTMSILSKRKVRPLSSYRQIQRSSSSTIPTNYRLNLSESPPLKQPSTPSPQASAKNRPIDKLLLLPTSVLITPTNSLVDETTISPTKKAPYELKLSGDMLNYCYVSDSGVKYQGQLLSTAV